MEFRHLKESLPPSSPSATSRTGTRRALLLALFAAMHMVAAPAPVGARAPTVDAALALVLESLGFGAVGTPTHSTPSGDVAVTAIQASPRGSRAGLQLVIVEVKRAQPLIDVRPVLRYGDSSAVIAGATAPNASAVINGGFFGYDAKGEYAPLGLVVSSGTIRNRRAAWRGGGILYQDKDRHLRIVPPKALTRSDHVVSAIQSKPILVQDGRLAIYSDDGERFNRSSISITTAGQIVLVGAFHSFGRAMAMKEFARVVAAIRSSTGSSVRVALAMDGGPGAHLYVPALKQHFGDSGKNFVPNVVQVVP